MTYVLPFFTVSVGVMVGVFLVLLAVRLLGEDE